MTRASVCISSAPFKGRSRYNVCSGGASSEPRVQSFMERYLDTQKADEHRVAIQLMRHTLMHTGALRFLYDEKNETGHLADLLRRHVSQFRGALHPHR